MLNVRFHKPFAIGPYADVGHNALQDAVHALLVGRGQLVGLNPMVLHSPVNNISVKAFQCELSTLLGNVFLKKNCQFREEYGVVVFVDKYIVFFPAVRSKGIPPLPLCFILSNTYCIAPSSASSMGWNPLPGSFFPSLHLVRRLIATGLNDCSILLTTYFLALSGPFCGPTRCGVCSVCFGRTGGVANAIN